MKDFINPYNDKIVDSIYELIKSWYLHEDNKEKFDNLINFNDYNLKNTSNPVYTESKIYRDCINIVICKFDDPYNKYYTIEQFNKMYKQAIRRFYNKFLRYTYNG